MKQSQMKQMIRPLMAAMRAQGRLPLPKPMSLSFQAQPHKRAVPKPRRKLLLKEEPSLVVPLTQKALAQKQEEEEESEGELVQEASDEEAVFISEADALL